MKILVIGDGDKQVVISDLLSVVVIAVASTVAAVVVGSESFCMVSHGHRETFSFQRSAHSFQLARKYTS